MLVATMRLRPRVNLSIFLLTLALVVWLFASLCCCLQLRHTKHSGSHHHLNHDPNHHHHHSHSGHKQHRPPRHNNGHRKQQHHHHTSSGNRLLKRQAVELAVNRLHILESLDGQLRQFAETELATEATVGYHPNSRATGGNSSTHNPRESGSPAHPSKRLVSQQQQQQQQLCSLNLKFGPPKWPTMDDRLLGGCLADPKLKRHIPPYMLNLHHQLLSECETLADAVRLMPYKSLMMRSFRQPALLASAAGKQVDDGQHESGPELELPPPTPPSLVVELSAIGTQHDDGGVNSHGRQQEVDAGGRQVDGSHLDEEEEEEESPLPSMDTDGRPVDYAGDYRPYKPAGATGGACHLGQRALMAHERSELCYWFQIGDQLQMRINGSLPISSLASAGGVQAPGVGAGAGGVPELHERLVEAELHLFKLLPEVLQVDREDERPRHNGGKPTAASNRPARRQNKQMTTNDRVARSPTSSYHLKTNLLEVSLYQVLPRKTSDRPLEPANLSSEGGSGSQRRSRSLLVPLEDEFPLRLLDIRRIDLHSTGWETFYVKRAVEDWIQDSGTNLGLVIKAKSMFEEPIRIGLIRFADMYDQRAADRRLHSEEPQKEEHERSHQRPSIGPLRDSSGNVNANAIENENEAKNKNKNGNESSRPDTEQEERKLVLEFNLDHQPILVIYTTATQTNATAAPTSTNHI